MTAARSLPVEQAIARAEASDPGFYLSPRNPIATRDQIAAETEAIALLATPEVRAARAQAANRWRIIAGDRTTPEAESRFDELIDEYCFCYALKAVNGDPGHPRIVAGLYGPGHDWFGISVPGSRGAGGDGPDQNYSFVPIDHGGRYVLRGQRIDPAPADTSYTLTGSLGFTMTLADIEARDLVTDSEGGFAITIGPEERPGDANHIRTLPEARYLFIRECRSDWRQLPALHRIERLNATVEPPLGTTAAAVRAARFIVDDAVPMFWLAAYMQSLAPNAMGPVINSGAVGGLTSQRIAFARLVISEDEAFVIRVGGRDAPFRDIVLHDFWFRTLDYWRRTSNFCNAQSRPDADGGYSYVAARRDPGVHNWLDTGGLSEVLLVHRWQGLPRGLSDTDGPAISGRLVPIAELDAHIEAGQRIDAGERRAQIAQREEEFALRYQA